MSKELIRRFEPILYFHQEETFFPSDAKRYLEHCALWGADKPFQDKTSWKVLIERSGIAAAQDEVSQPGEDDDTYLGAPSGSAFPFLLTDENEDRFLNPSGWIGEDGSHEAEVDSTTANKFAALGLLARLYGPGDLTKAALRDSRFWYHAEVFDIERIADLNRQEGAGPDQPVRIPLDKLLRDQFTEPLVICYYLFYPGRIEGLQGCEGIDTADNFGSFAGEWACVSILVDRDDPGDDFEPKWLGLASRNANREGQGGRVFDAEGRVGMVVHPWADVDVFATGPGHLRLFVARGTHSLYLTPDPSASNR